MVPGPPPLSECGAGLRCSQGSRGGPERPRGSLLGGEPPKSSVGSQIRSRTELRQLLVSGLFLINSSLAHAGSALSLPPGSASPMHIEELDGVPRAKYKSHLKPRVHGESVVCARSITEGLPSSASLWPDMWALPQPRHRCPVCPQAHVQLSVQHPTPISGNSTPFSFGEQSCPHASLRVGPTAELTDENVGSFQPP